MGGGVRECCRDPPDPPCGLVDLGLESLVQEVASATVSHSAFPDDCVTAYRRVGASLH